MQGSGQAPNDLLDQRDQALATLSQKLQISTVQADDGSVSVFIAGGQRLVLGAQAQTLRVPIRDDNATEGDEQFLLRLESPTGGAALGARPPTPPQAASSVERTIAARAATRAADRPAGTFDIGGSPPLSLSGTRSCRRDA